MDSVRRLADRLIEAYNQADDAWWPVDRVYHRTHGTDARFEVMVGAILAQNTSWRSVQAALARLKGARLMSAESVLDAPGEALTECVRPAGTYRKKVAYLRAACRRLVDDFAGRLGRLFDGPTATVRRRLLAMPGIGPETADAILVYAARRPRFVVDAYTRRIAGRVGVLAGGEPYDDVQARFEAALPSDAAYLARAHAAFVEHAKARCARRAPSCPGCPVEDVCRKVGVPVSAQA